MKNICIFFKNPIIEATLTIFVATLIGCLLLFSSYAIPTQPIKENVKESSLVHIKEGEVYTWKRGIPGNKIDNFTASIMLNTAAFPKRGKIIYDAMMNHRLDYGKPTKVIDLYYATHDTDSLSKAKIVKYPRYWHGYLITLKPLLFFFNILQIRFLNALFQILLLLITLYLIILRLNTLHALAFITTILYINPITTALSLQFTSIYIITLVTMITLLLRTNTTPIWKIFLLSGIATAFFDLLTSPLITLGIPLILSTLLQNNSLKQDIKQNIVLTISWFYGYSGMWFMKWIIASIITPDNIIKDGIQTALYRTFGNGSQEIKYQNWNAKQAILNNINEIYSTTSIAIMLIFLFLVSASYFIKKYKFIADYKNVILLIIGTCPFINKITFL